MANLRAGIIGLGMMGANHARVLSNLEGVDLVAVADPQGDAKKYCQILMCSIAWTMLSNLELIIV